MPGKAASDLELVEGLVRRFGTAAALAAAYGGIKANTPHEWLRRLRRGQALSDDKRRRLHSLAGTAPDGTNFAAPTTSPAPVSPDEVALMADATGYEAFRKLATIFKNRTRRPDIWVAITHNLDVFARTAQGAERARAGASAARKARRQK